MNPLDPLDPLDPLTGDRDFDEDVEPLDQVVAPLPVAPLFGGVMPTFPAAGEQTDPVGNDGLDLSDLRAFMDGGALDGAAAVPERFNGLDSDGPTVGRMLAARFGADMTMREASPDVFDFDGLKDGGTPAGTDMRLDPFLDGIDPAWAGDIAPFLDPTLTGGGFNDPPRDPDGAPPADVLEFAPLPQDTPDGWVV